MRGQGRGSLRPARPPCPRTLIGQKGDEQIPSLEAMQAVIEALERCSKVDAQRKANLLAGKDALLNKFTEALCDYYY